MPTFSGSSFFGLEEMHLIGRGIGSLMYNLIIVDNDLKRNCKFFYTRRNGKTSMAGYPFYIPRRQLHAIGQQIAKSRKSIPTSFQGSFKNIISKTDGTRAVDWLDFLLYIVPTLVVPYLRTAAAKKAVLSLVKGCALALQWSLTEEKINEMQR